MEYISIRVRNCFLLNTIQDTFLAEKNDNVPSTFFFPSRIHTQKMTIHKY